MLSYFELKAMSLQAHSFADGPAEPDLAAVWQKPPRRNWAGLPVLMTVGNDVMADNDRIYQPLVAQRHDNSTLLRLTSLV